MAEIDYLANHPDWIATIAEWHHNEWGHLHENATLQRRIEKLEAQLNYDTIPIAFVAKLKSVPVGSASIVKHDLPDRKDLSPWVASVYVLPEYRKQGIGSALVNKAVEKAHEMQIPRLYLFTWNQEKLYAELGWEVIEKTVAFGFDVVIMSVYPSRAAT